MIFNKKLRKSSAGFTIVELLVSTVIFSLILLGAMAALVQIGRLYYKGITTARTQEQARSVISELSQSIQFSSQNVTVASPPITGPEIAITNNDLETDIANATSFLCIGPRRYSFVIDRKLSFNPDQNSILEERRKEARHVLWVDEPIGGCVQNPSVIAANMSLENPCDPNNTPNDLSDDTCANGRELLSENMRISKFSIIQNGNLYSINVSLLYGDDDLLRLEGDRYVCEGSRIGGEFCALSELSTTVLKRI